MLLDFENIFSEELEQFKEEADLKYLRVTDIWTLKYTETIRKSLST